MQPASIKTRIFLFLYSTANLVGCTLAIGALLLFFSNIISDWWLPIVISAYIVGWLAVPGDKELEFKVRNELTQANLTNSIENLIEASKSRLPHEAIDRLQHIHTLVTELAPRLFSGEVAMSSVSALTNAVTRDLPMTVQNYLNLPTAFATIHKLEGGKTCRQLLLEQLDLLCDQLTIIAQNIYKDDADALIVNGKFLEDKFHSVSFID
jgi:hypothetical protein